MGGKGEWDNADRMDGEFGILFLSGVGGERCAGLGRRKGGRGGDGEEGEGMGEGDEGRGGGGKGDGGLMRRQ